jgi:nitrite reductase (NADH) large subunit
VCGARLAGDDQAAYVPPPIFTSLKITGVDVFSAGALMAEADSDDEITYLDSGQGIYKKLVLREGKIAGVMLYGDIADSAWYLKLMRERANISSLRPNLVFGQGPVEEATAQDDNQSADVNAASAVERRAVEEDARARIDLSWIAATARPAYG